MVRQRAFDPSEIVGVNASLPRVEVRLDLVWRVSEHLRPLVVKLDLVGGDIPFPDADLSAFDGEFGHPFGVAVNIQ